MKGRRKEKGCYCTESIGREWVSEVRFSKNDERKRGRGRRSRLEFMGKEEEKEKKWSGARVTEARVRD